MAWAIPPTQTTSASLSAAEIALRPIMPRATVYTGGIKYYPSLRKGTLDRLQLHVNSAADRGAMRTSASSAKRDTRPRSRSFSRCWVIPRVAQPRLASSGSCSRWPGTFACRNPTAKCKACDLLLMCWLHVQQPNDPLFGEAAHPFASGQSVTVGAFPCARCIATEQGRCVRFPALVEARHSESPRVPTICTMKCKAFPFRNQLLV